MCGFVGIFSKQGSDFPVSPFDLAFAVERLKHRGPDAQRLAVLFPEGQVMSHSLETWQEDPALAEFGGSPIGCLGHARLKIIDVSDAANQPLRYLAPNGKTYWVAYNGEIYNHQALRRSLEAKGYAFETRCDTEILPALYDLMGPAMLKELNGMFAFAVWDAQEQTLFLSRDRYGIKPLYISHFADGAIAFASELKGLSSLPGIGKTLNCQAIYEHFTFQFSLNNRTFIREIEHFPKGHCALWKADTGHFLQKRYWEPEFGIDLTRNEADWFNAIENALGEAVQSQLLGDAPIGSFLSGGMDTAAITAFAAAGYPSLQTITCGFDTSGLSGDECLFDERGAAKKLAELFRTAHHECVVDQTTLPSVLDQLVWHLDDFQAGISYQNLVAAKFARRYMSVILSGVGGDELFAGYPWRYRLALDTSLSAESFEDGYYRIWTRLLSDERKQALFSGPVLSRVEEFDTKRLFQEAFRKGRMGTPLQQALRFDMDHFLPALLAVEDRLSMACGLESRVPFLDNNLADLCLAMPDALKLKRQDHECVAKYALKRSLEKRLPEWVLNARKQGFTPPDAAWYRGALSGWIEARLFSESFLDRGIVLPECLKQFWQEHQLGLQNHRFLIWSLLCLESWCRQFFDSGVAAKHSKIP